MKRVGIIQARLGSTRLPLKMLLSLHGKPIIEWVVTRVRQSKLLDEIVVAIPNTKENNTLAKYLQKLNVKVHRGSENDVLSRFYKVAKEYNATHIIRICADNPLIDGEEIDNLIKFYEKEQPDYAYNHIPKNNNYPDGIGAEMVSFELFEKIHNDAKEQGHREHCLSYITDNYDKFNIKTFDPLDNLLCYPELKFDVDTFSDYEKLAMKDIKININSKELIALFLEKK